MALVLVLVLVFRRGRGELGLELARCLCLEPADVAEAEAEPLVLPDPRLPVRAEHRAPQRRVVDEALEAALHAPVLGLHAAQLV